MWLKVSDHSVGISPPVLYLFHMLKTKVRSSTWISDQLELPYDWCVPDGSGIII
jgi:hypothetical protein